MIVVNKCNLEYKPIQEKEIVIPQDKNEEEQKSNWTSKNKKNSLIELSEEE